MFTASAPGRVNLIGEHIDYNGGMVLPAALAIGLEVDLEPRAGDVVTIRADHYEEAAKRQMDESANGHWSDPALGAVLQARSMGLLSGGADLAIRSTIPEGSGLSSSAALIVAILKAARAAGADGNRPDPSDTEIAVAARAVENDFMGVPCGIMDQMAVALAAPGTAMALNTKTLTHSIVDLPRSHGVVVVHSGRTRRLTDGRYAALKEECDTAKAHFGTDDLCLLDPAEIARSNLAEPYRRRAYHCATEHRRVLSAIAALQAQDIPALGRAMNDSHISMRDDFEMSLPAIDTLVADACELGAKGARLTGGGFGGCIVAVVDKTRQDAWLSQLLDRHSGARFIGAV